MEGKFTFQASTPAVFKKDKDSEDKELMQFSVAGYTGAVMESGYGSIAIDLSGMSFRNEITPMFQHHDSTRIVGHANKKEIDQNGLMLHGVISGVGEAAREVVESSKNGFPWQASVGVDIKKYRILEKDEEATVNGRQMVGPGVLLSETEVFETSFVPLGRDRNTSSALFSKDFEDKLQPKKEQKMEEVNKVEEVKATVSEMRLAFPNDAEFALDAIERGLSVLEAKAEYCDKLLAQRDELAEELAEMQAAFADKGAGEGEEPVEYFEESQPEVFSKETPEAKVLELVNKARAEFNYNQVDALNYVIKNNPQLANQLI